MALPIRISSPARPPAQTPRTATPTPTEVQATAARTNRPVQEVVRAVRQRDRPDALPWAEVSTKLPVRLG